MEDVKKVEITTERIEHHFWCDECGGYMGHTVELDDGYYQRLGEYELKFYLDGWYELKKTICPACYVKYFDKVRESLFEAGFYKSGVY